MESSFLEKLQVSTDTYQRMIALRRELHQYPELSYQEKETAQRIARFLDQIGATYRKQVGGHGIVVDIPGTKKGSQKGPIIALRGDMDALPIEEKTGLEFSSQNPGVMHACGHDGHTAMAFGATEILLKHSPPPLPVRVLFQPAEEETTGALAMIQDGALDGVGMIFGGHLDRRFEAGHFVITEGAVNASTDVFEIKIQGKQCHGARPHEGIDSIVVGSALVTSLQSISAREIDPSFPCIVTVGEFHAGTASNVIAGTATLKGTLRAQTSETREHLVRSVRRMAESVAQTYGAKIEWTHVPGVPPLVNLPAETRLAREAAQALVSQEQIIPLPTANLGGEDFACFLERVPGCFIRYGGKFTDREPGPAHSSTWDFDERALAYGAAWMARVAHLAGNHLA